MSNLVLAYTHKYFGIGGKDDHCILDGGRVVGRIFRLPQAPEGRSWSWTITDRYFLHSIDNMGHCATCQEAMAEFKARWTG